MIRQFIKQSWVIAVCVGLQIPVQHSSAQTTNTINTYQSLAGTTWNVSVPAISNAPYNFIFNAVNKTGNVLKPDKTLTDFVWSEDGNGNWTITVEEMVNGVKKSENFYGKITGNTGTGYYTNSANVKVQKPFTMIKE